MRLAATLSNEKDAIFLQAGVITFIKIIIKKLAGNENLILYLRDIYITQITIPYIVFWVHFK
jgi:hypothetical protein